MKAMTKSALAIAVVLALVPAISDLHAGQATPRQQPGAEMTVYAPEQHELYDGQFRLSAGRVYMVGGLNDPAGWNHIDNDASTVHAVEGTVEIDINEITNTGQFIARLTVPEGDLVVELDRFNEFNPCQDGGVAAFIYEHGDSGCGNTNWPKTLLYIAGWGSCDAERSTPPRGLSGALHGDARYPRPRDTRSELPAAQQEIGGRRCEPRSSAA